jgi:hypothetical protein
MVCNYILSLKTKFNVKFNIYRQVRNCFPFAHPGSVRDAMVKLKDNIKPGLTVSLVSVPLSVYLDLFQIFLSFIVSYWVITTVVLVSGRKRNTFNGCNHGSMGRSFCSSFQLQQLQHCRSHWSSFWFVG